ncbi:MAG TPA: helix-turn-helix domain-containing protein [Ktedonobacteraceae bacterium]|nr:helix-turn-helix domain-containing protein [Ktedonobacteraceae bacterium]
MLKEINTNRECITTAQAAERSGLSKVHLTRLLRNGVLEGVQLGREWLVYADSLEKYLASPRKSGPKGPIKKPTQAEQSESLTNRDNA